MPKIRVLLADDHAIVREGVRMILNAQPDMEVIGEASNGVGALSLANTLKPDLVLMDIGMPGMNGLEATRALKEAQPLIQILILTMLEDEDYFFRILAVGASGYVLKGAGSDELLSAIRWQLRQLASRDAAEDADPAATGDAARTFASGTS